MKLLTTILLLSFLSGCASTSLYSWGGYQDELYTYYDKPAEREDVISNLEKHIRKLEKASKKVPPGLYAELGTFYFERGDQERAVEFYKKEMDAWPESKGLMTALISNLGNSTVKEEASDAN